MHIQLPTRSYGRRLAEVINQHGGWFIPKVIDDFTRHSMLVELETQYLEVQPERIGKHQVKQSFSATATFNSDSLFTEVADNLSGALEHWFIEDGVSPFVTPLAFTDLVVQRYPKGDTGISPHRDGKSFINLIAVLVLEGEGSFRFCEDRSGTNPRLIRNEPGDLIVMRGVGFCGTAHQPFHFVDNIRTRRTTFGMRQKLKAPA